ncbi:MAG: hypothetical protein M3N48_02260 [Verrucomicrobiota bacterium]|nr:hypothetical protein [Verrucomicrobiota bacterium]
MPVCHRLLMHKDTPPGIFDFADRSVRYLIGFWFVAGILLSVFVRVGLLVTRVDADNAPPNAEISVEKATERVRTPTPPPSDPSVRY